MTEGAEGDRSAFGAFLRGVGNELADVAQIRGRIAEAEDRRNWKQLFDSVTPIAGESLRGLVARACRANGLPNSWGVLQHMGIAHRNRVGVSEDPAVNSAELAHAMRVQEDEVRTRRYDPMGQGTVSFFGMAVNVKRVETSVRRFSPAALATATHHRAAWELRDIPFCFEQWDMLQERCWCEAGGVVQRWTRTSSWPHECDRCGDPLVRNEPVFVPDEMRLALSVLRAVVDPALSNRDAATPLPKGLEEADRGRIFRVVVRLARALSPEAENYSFEEPSERLRGLAAAAALLRGWPRPIYDLDWPPDTKAGTIMQLGDWWRDLAGRTPLPAGRRKRAPAPRAKARLRFPSTLIGLRPATELARMRPEQLMAAWHGGHVTAHQRRHGPRSVPAFDRDEVIALASVWHARVPRDSYVRQTGLTLYGLEQLIALEWIVMDMPQLDGEPSLRRDRIDEFEARLPAGADHDLVNPVPIARLLQDIDGRLKPTGAIIARLLDGECPYSLVTGPRLIDRLVVAEADAALLAATHFDRSDHAHFDFTPTMSQTEAVAAFGASSSQAEILDGLSHDGVNPKRYALVDVEARMQAYVCLSQLARASREHPASVHSRLRRAGIAPTLPGLYSRASVAELGLDTKVAADARP